MGAGKTSVGRALAETLGRVFYDTDTVVEDQAGRPIGSFFPHQEAEFRRLEARAVADLVKRGPSVIALGGGALADPATRALLRERSVLVHLYVPWAELEPRLRSLTPGRPLLEQRSIEAIRELYDARLAAYREAAIEVRVAGDVAETAAAVLRSLAAAPRPSD